MKAYTVRANQVMNMQVTEMMFAFSQEVNDVFRAQAKYSESLDYGDVILNNLGDPERKSVKVFLSCIKANTEPYAGTMRFAPERANRDKRLIMFGEAEVEHLPLVMGWEHLEGIRNIHLFWTLLFDKLKIPNS